MKYTSALTSIILSSVVLFTACAKNSKELISKQTANGSWQWRSTNGGIANNLHETPASSGNVITLTLTNNNAFTISKNGTITAQGNYTIINRNCIHDGKAKQVIDFLSGDVQDMMIENIDATTLTLSDENYDGLTSVYERTVK